MRVQGRLILDAFAITRLAYMARRTSSESPPVQQAQASRRSGGMFAQCSWCSVVAFIFLIQAVYSARAHGQVPLEYSRFNTLCTVVEFEAPRDFYALLDQNFNRINRSVAAAIEARLRERNLTFPLEYGRQCFPGKVGVAPFQLSLQFHVVLVHGPDRKPPIVASLIAHGYFQGATQPPHYYRTRIFFCPDETRVSECLIENVMSYFDETALKLIEQGKK